METFIVIVMSNLCTVTVQYLYCREATALTIENRGDQCTCIIHRTSVGFRPCLIHGKLAKLGGILPYGYITLL